MARENRDYDNAERTCHKDTKSTKLHKESFVNPGVPCASVATILLEVVTAIIILNLNKNDNGHRFTPTLLAVQRDKGRLDKR
jgi:hypothetical protein